MRIFEGISQHRGKEENSLSQKLQILAHKTDRLLRHKVSKNIINGIPMEQFHDIKNPIPKQQIINSILHKIEYYFKMTQT